MMMPVGLTFLLLELWLFRHLLVERTGSPTPAAAKPRPSATSLTPQPRFTSVIQMPVGR
jgi:hypothetical protein